MQIFTIGHSTRILRQLLRLLKQYGIEMVVGVRRFPSSIREPHLNKENLEQKLPERGLRYVYLGEGLGGFRKETYKQYVKKRAFREGIEELLSIAVQGRTAVMCAELLWFRCYRRYISDESSERVIR